jgi:hypothetical protein
VSTPLCQSSCTMVRYGVDTHYYGDYYRPTNKTAETSLAACESACLIDKVCAGITFTVRSVDPCMLYSKLLTRTRQSAHTSGAVKCVAGSTVAATCGHFSPSPGPPAPPSPSPCCGAACGNGCGGGSLSSTVPFAKHPPPVDPTWPSNYAQELRLLHVYNNDLRVIVEHYASLKAYVEYMRGVTSCPHCRRPTNTHPTIGHSSLPDFYMNGDWLEWRRPPKELASSGPIMSSFHFILDLEILRDFAAKLSTVSGKLQPDGFDPADHGKYAALATRMRAAFQAAYHLRVPRPTS